VVRLIARAALARLESRGAHYRTDYTAKSADFKKHSIARRGREIEFRGENMADRVDSSSAGGTHSPTGERLPAD
jgi:succinate dehydrogenase/fumarate reductase flavoprotein subunit